MSSAMTPSPGQSSGQRSTLSVRSMSGEPQTPDQIEAEIEVQREALAETIDALSAKLDVKAQAQARVEEVKQTAQGKVAQVKHTAQTKVAQVKGVAQTTVGSAQAGVGSASARIGSGSGTARQVVRTGTVTPAGRPRPELVAFGATVLLATAVLWWRER